MNTIINNSYVITLLLLWNTCAWSTSSWYPTNTSSQFPGQSTEYNLSTSAQATPVYCPNKSGYIQVGMSADQVLAACGNPTSHTEMNTQAMQNLPIKQILFNNQGSSSAFYGVWNLSTSSTGTASLEVDIVNNAVYALKLNGSTINSTSLCQGQTINVQDPEVKVYNLCGTPSSINNTFITVPVPSQTKPQQWFYQSSPYQPSLRLLIVDGKLISIN